MKRLLIVAALLGAVLGIFLGAVWWQVRSARPDVLIRRLRRARGDKRQLTMRLNLASGDVVPVLIGAFHDRSAAATFRADILDLLFKRNLRAEDDRINSTLREALSDSEPVVRRRAAGGFAVYTDEHSQVILLPSVADPDPEVRRHAYRVFGGWSLGARRKADAPIWRALSKQQREALVQLCRSQMETETDPELRLLAASVVGRQVEILCTQATACQQRGDVELAGRLLEQALQLDQQNHQARIRLVRHVLATGKTQRALALAKQYEALLHIPLLKAAPVIDGDPADPAWECAFASDSFYSSQSRFAAKLAQGKSRFLIGHCGGKVYVAILGFEDDLDALVATHSKRDSDVWRDDCAEIFFDPSASGQDVYLFIINVAGVLKDYYRGESKRNIECEYATGVFKERGYWACEFAVEIKRLQKEPISGDTVWAFNVDRARIGPASEHCQWWPTFGYAWNYHLFPLATFELASHAANTTAELAP